MDQSRGVSDGVERDISSTETATPSSAVNPPINDPEKSWKPDETFLQSLISMGFSTVMAKKALFHTNNESTEVAIDWIFNNPEYSDAFEVEQPARQLVNSQQQSTSANFSANDDLFKMVFVVNAELTMGVGKIAAQVAHAALGLHRILLQHQAKYGEPLLCWTEYGETKIVLRGQTTDHLIELESKAISLSLPCYLVHDAGRTQVHSGSTTVLGIFGSNSMVDQVTGSLRLY